MAYIGTMYMRSSRFAMESLRKCSRDSVISRNNIWNSKRSTGTSQQRFIPSLTFKSFNNEEKWYNFEQKRFQSNQRSSKPQNNSKVAIYLISGAVAILAAAYAAVPLYRILCQQMGFDGQGKHKKGEGVASLEEKRNMLKDVPIFPLKITFNSMVSPDLPWSFVPVQSSIEVLPGESILVFYKAKNHSDKPITGFATYSVLPHSAAKHFNKIQCFCFDEQRLGPGEEVDMPVFFYIDPKFVTDRRMIGVDQLILSYTFFNTHSDEGES